MADEEFNKIVYSISNRPHSQWDTIDENYETNLSIATSACLVKQHLSTTVCPYGKRVFSSGIIQRGDYG